MSVILDTEDIESDVIKQGQITDARTVSIATDDLRCRASSNSPTLVTSALNKDSLTNNGQLLT